LKLSCGCRECGDSAEVGFSAGRFSNGSAGKQPTRLEIAKAIAKLCQHVATNRAARPTTVKAKLLQKCIRDTIRICRRPLATSTIVLKRITDIKHEQMMVMLYRDCSEPKSQFPKKFGKLSKGMISRT
jgi:hypothetical protein